TIWTLPRPFRDWAARWAWMPPINGPEKPSANGVPLSRWMSPPRKKWTICGVRWGCKPERAFIWQVPKTNKDHHRNGAWSLFYSALQCGPVNATPKASIRSARPKAPPAQSDTHPGQIQRQWYVYRDSAV